MNLPTLIEKNKCICNHGNVEDCPQIRCACPVHHSMTNLQKIIEKMKKEIKDKVYCNCILCQENGHFVEMEWEYIESFLTTSLTETYNSREEEIIEARRLGRIEGLKEAAEALPKYEHEETPQSDGSMMFRPMVLGFNNCIDQIKSTLTSLIEKK